MTYFNALDLLKHSFDISANARWSAHWLEFSTDAGISRATTYLAFDWSIGGSKVIKQKINMDVSVSINAIS